MIEGLVGLAVMMVIAFLRVPIAYAMGIVGIVGYAYMRDWNWLVASAMVQTKIYETGRNYTLSVVPLFILMGNFVTRAGMSEELFRAAHTFIGHLRGGLAMATVWASAGFGGICGSSIATTATMAKVAYPSMKRFGYADQVAAGTVAGAGTLGIMIPPSTILVILGTAMEELSMVLLTMPVFFPVIVHLGFDPVWFGIIIVRVVEIGLISPPVGMNMFVLKTLLPTVSTGTVFRGVMPFMWADVIRLALLVAFPIISLWLPRMMR